MRLLEIFGAVIVPVYFTWSSYLQPLEIPCEVLFSTNTVGKTGMFYYPSSVYRETQVPGALLHVALALGGSIYTSRKFMTRFRHSFRQLGKPFREGFLSPH